MLFVPAFAWLLYIALEPHLRRVWPETMIGWSRLLAGSVRDPLVGRDVLVGVLVAIGDGLILALHTLLRRWSGRPPQFPVGASGNPFDGMAASSDLLLGGRYALSRIIGSVMSIPVWGTTMLTFLLLFVLYVLLRRRSLAIAAMILGLTADLRRRPRGLAARQRPCRSLRAFASPTSRCSRRCRRRSCSWPSASVCSRCWSRQFVSMLLTLLPIAIDSSVPYASSSRLIVATVIALAAYGWHTALAGRPMFGAAFFGDRIRPSRADQGNLKVSSSSNRLARRYRRVQEAVMNTRNLKTWCSGRCASCAVLVVGAAFAALLYRTRSPPPYLSSNR